MCITKQNFVKIGDNVVEISQFLNFQDGSRLIYWTSKWQQIAKKGSIHITDQILSKRVPLLWQRDHATRLSVEILQLQNIPFKNQSPGPIVWHYLCDPTCSRFRTIPECYRHTQTNRRTDRHTMTACIALSIASRGKNRPLHCQPSIIARQRASVDSKLLDTPRNIGFYRISER